MKKYRLSIRLPSIEGQPQFHVVDNISMKDAVETSKKLMKDIYNIDNVNINVSKLYNIQSRPQYCGSLIRNFLKVEKV